MVGRLYLPSARRLPNGRGAWVKFKKQAAGDFTEFVEMSASAIEQIADVIARGIESWNLEDDDGNVLPIEGQYLRQLPSEDFWYIATNIYRRRKEPDLELEVMNYLAADEGEDAKAPWAYVVYKYRRIFRVSWPDFVQTPLHIVQRDLMMMNLEAQHQANKQQLETPNA